MKRPSFVPDAPVVIFVPGVWDLLHYGHLTLLHRARALADAGGRGILVVGVVSDAGTAAYKGRPPEQSQALRVQTIARLTFVDVVEVQPTTDPTPLLERFRPHALVHGDDWSRLREGHETLDRLGIEFVRLPYTPGISTTLLREAS